MTRAAIENTSALYARPHLTVSKTTLKIEFNLVVIRHMAVSMQLSTVNNIFESNTTFLKATQQIVEYYLEYRRKTYIKSSNF